MIKQEKVIIFSHENDIDGLGNIILGKMAFGEIEYVLASNVNILEAKFRDCLKKGLLHNYDRIFVTDLALYNPSLEMVSKDPELSKKVLVFDHHRSAINEGCGGYSFTKIVEISRFLLFLDAVLICDGLLHCSHFVLKNLFTVQGLGY